MNRSARRLWRVCGNIWFPSGSIVGGVGLFLQGSQNYNLDYEGSDIDTKAIVLPSFSDFVLNNKPVSTTHLMENDEHVDFKDIRLMFDCIKKQNVNFVEILFTHYYILNPMYADLLQPVLDAREEIARYNNYAGMNCIVGMAYEKQKAMEHPYPATIDKIRAYGYDPKQLHHQQDLVFQTLHERVLNDLASGKNVVYDATNINYKRRMEFLRQVNAMKLPSLRTVCVFLTTPYEECLERNANRERSVPRSVIRKMYEKFDIPMKVEGWDEIWVFGDIKDYYGRLEALMSHLSKLEHDNPHHTYTIGQHCIAAWQYLISHYKDYDACLLRATLLHDIGKEKTKVFYDTKGNPSEIAHYYHHERVGAYDSFCYTSDLSNDQRLMVALLIRWHMWPYVVDKSDNPNKTARKVRRLLGEDIWKQIAVLNDCDRHAH